MEPKFTGPSFTIGIEEELMILDSESLALANAIAGAELLDVPIPGTTKRYLGLQFVLTGTFTGAGAVQGGVVAENDNQPYITSNTGL